MKKIQYFLVLIVSICTVASAWALTGNEILRKVDDNITSTNKILTSKMIIHGRRGDRTIESKSWILGNLKSFTEYLSPARERGTKMLKLENELWTYSPQTDRTIRIAGHMLRQSVMGSDLSYEDYMEDPKMIRLYDATIDSDTVYLERPCWILTLVAKDEGISYYSRKIWVDKEKFTVLKENRYAKSGKLLKTTEVKNVEWMNNRWVPTHIVFKDVLQNGKGTEFIIESVKFDQDIPEHIFTKAVLRR